MNNGQIFDFINIVLRKEKEGNSITPEKFTLLLVESMWEKINAEIGQFERNQVITNSLRSLKESEDIAVTASGTFDMTTLSENYLTVTSLFYTYNTRVRKIDIVTDDEWSRASSSSLEAPTDEFPIAKIYGDTLEFDPIASATVTMTYLREPNEPYFDYYFDANDKIIYLTEGQSYALQANEEYRDGTTPPATVNSISVELPFPANERVDVAYKILQKLGVQLQEVLPVQFGAQKEAKEEML